MHTRHSPSFHDLSAMAPYFLLSLRWAAACWLPRADNDAATMTVRSAARRVCRGEVCRRIRYSMPLRVLLLTLNATASGLHIFLVRAACFRIDNRCRTGEPSPRQQLAAVCSWPWHAAASSRCFPHVPFFRYDAASVLHAGLVCSILLAPASRPASTPLPAAWHISAWEKPRVAHAHIERLAVRTRTLMRAARLVR